MEQAWIWITHKQVESNRAFPQKKNLKLIELSIKPHKPRCWTQNESNSNLIRPIDWSTGWTEYESGWSSLVFNDKSCSCIFFIFVHQDRNNLKFSSELIYQWKRNKIRYFMYTIWRLKCGFTFRKIGGCATYCEKVYVSHDCDI